MQEILKSLFRQGYLIKKSAFPREQQSHATAACDDCSWNAIAEAHPLPLLQNASFRLVNT
jgi:hypothetical protein